MRRSIEAEADARLWEQWRKVRADELRRGDFSEAWKARRKAVRNERHCGWRPAEEQADSEFAPLRELYAAFQGKYRESMIQQLKLEPAQRGLSKAVLKQVEQRQRFNERREQRRAKALREGSGVRGDADGSGSVDQPTKEDISWVAAHLDDSSPPAAPSKTALALLGWACENRSDFYRILFVKALPTEDSEKEQVVFSDDTADLLDDLREQLVMLRGTGFQATVEGVA